LLQKHRLYFLSPMPSLLTVNLVFDCCRSSKKSKGEENHRTEEEREREEAENAR